MKSYKCEYCNLTNWTDVVVCKRCQMPNPYLPEHNGINDENVANNHFTNINQQESEFLQEPINQTQQSNLHYPIQQNLNNYNQHLPPPPNVYGDRTGNTDVSNNFGQGQMYAGGGYQEVIPNDVYIRFEEALININKAYKAGKVYTIIMGVLFLFASILILFAVGTSFSAPGGAEAGGIVAFGMVFIFLFFIVITAILYGLSYGVKRKSRVCAIILVVLFGLGILTNGLSLGMDGNGGKSIVSLGISILMTYFFALGVKGTFAYQEIIQKYPSLKE